MQGSTGTSRLTSLNGKLSTATLVTMDHKRKADHDANDSFYSFGKHIFGAIPPTFRFMIIAGCWFLLLSELTARGNVTATIELNLS